MGEAAGVAAVQALAGGISVRDVDTRALQAQLVRQGALVHRPDDRNDGDDANPTESGIEESIHWQAVDAARAYD